MQGASGLSTASCKLIGATAHEIHVTVNIQCQSAVKTLNFPYSYLRDNCKSNFHPTTLQRLTGLNRSILSSRAESVRITDEDALSIEWKNVVTIGVDASKTLDNISTYSVKFLLEHSLEKDDRLSRQVELYRQIQGLTAADFFKQRSESPFIYSSILENDETLLKLMDRLWTHGIAFVTGVPHTTATEEVGESFFTNRRLGDDGDDNKDSRDKMEHEIHVQRLQDRLAYSRETNYGRIFHVKANLMNPNNQAYTSKVLPLHTDLPFYQLAPDIQMLHCVSQAGQGGESVFCDGVSAVQKLKEKYLLEGERGLEKYRLLTTAPVQFSDTSDKFCLKDQKPIVKEVHVGEESFITQLFFNEGVRCQVLNGCEWDKVPLLYEAMIELQEMFQDPDLNFDFRMNAGDLCIWNNNRVMHGRAAFTVADADAAPKEVGAGDGNRHLVGGYVDWDDVLSKRRVLTTDGGEYVL